MNIRNLINRIRSRASAQPEMTDEAALKFLNVLENLHEEEISCGEIYTILDEFVEKEAKGRDAHKLAPLIREHLDMCSECCDEYEALLSVVENTKEDSKN
jgi:flagellar biosynthesis component FlhA